MKHIAVVLCGSGYKDGSEIRESVLTLLALSHQGAHFTCFACDDFQYDVVNCLTGETVANEKRHMLIESARIARGDVRPLTELNVKNFDGIIFPGGFGAAKNLCTFAFHGSSGSVRADVQSILDSFYQSKKPIGAICIAPAILALAFRNKGLTLTVGAAGETADEIIKLGHKHQACRADECVVDRTHRMATCPAYMYDDAPLADIYRGIEGVVKAVLE